MVPRDEEDFEGAHFLPHHGVLREDRETTKLRIVFDGSARVGKNHYSLNDCLEKGPNLTPHVFEVLAKFRSYPVGLTADIEKAFHQISVNPADRDQLRFLWFKNVNMKIWFQKLCVDKVNWEDRLEGTMLAKWNHLFSEFSALAKLNIPRCCFVRERKPVCRQLHGFRDASEQAIAAVVYLRTVYEAGDVDVRLIASKTKVAPLNKESIPRLELMGAYILSKLVDTVCNAFKLLPFEVDVYYWVDSFTTLCWIKNHRPWKQYVQHRVDVIRKLTDIEKWRFCPGNMNPADIPSRGCSGKDLVESELWWSGPTFLREPSKLWPETPSTSAPNTTSEELVKHTPAITHSLATAALNRTLYENLEEIMDIERYGSKLKLLRVTAYVLKFIRLLRGDRGAVKSKELKAEDLNFAEVTWIRGVQAHSFATERQDLRHGYEGSKHVKQFDLYLDEDKIIRCKGRINNADTTEESKNPVLLPSRHRYTELLIRQRHDHVHHNGVKETLNAIRETHWVLKGREAVKRVIRKCTICRRYEGKPFIAPPSPELPTDRVYEGPPFTYTGIDFAGSLYVNSASPENRSKAYCCINTCCPP